MIKTITANSVLASAIMIVCAIFTYGGAVNLGWSGFAMALPFIAIWLFISRKSKKPLMIISVVVFISILGFYGLKKTNNGIFYPANGMTIILNKKSCFDVYSNYILISEFIDSDQCLDNIYKKEDTSIRKSKIVEAGTQYTINRTEVSYADMGEKYIPHANDIDGDLHIYNLSHFKKSNGDTLQEMDLRQPYFFYPSLLMLWPAFPLSIFAVFSR